VRRGASQGQPVTLEAEIQNRIFLRFGRDPDVTLWRNNTGQHAAEIATRAHLERLLSYLLDARESRRVDAVGLLRSLLAEKQRFTRYGLCKGSSDIIGIVQTLQTYPTAEHVGCLQRYDSHGVFLALEVKQPGKRPTPEQQMFLDLVNRRGGVGECVHSEDEAGAAIERARRL